MKDFFFTSLPQIGETPEACDLYVVNVYVTFTYFHFDYSYTSCLTAVAGVHESTGVQVPAIGMQDIMIGCTPGNPNVYHTAGEHSRLCPRQVTWVHERDMHISPRFLVKIDNAQGFSINSSRVTKVS